MCVTQRDIGMLIKGVYNFLKGCMNWENKKNNIAGSFSQA
jgi:hypothetical protein